MNGAAAQARSCLALYVRLQQYSSSRPSIQLCIALAATLAPALALIAAACLIARICAGQSLCQMGSEHRFPSHACIASCHMHALCPCPGGLEVAICRMQVTLSCEQTIILHTFLNDIT